MRPNPSINPEASDRAACAGYVRRLPPQTKGHFVRLFLALILIATSILSHAQGAARLKDPAAARQLTDQIMSKIAAGEFEAGLRLAQPYVIIPDSEFETMVGQGKLQTPMMVQRFGKSIGSEFIREDRAGENVFRIVQINRFEKHATRWTFIFYRTPTGWCINTFYFDDKIQALFPSGG